MSLRIHIASIAVRDYKCFLDSGVARFGPGINIIVGRNNSGKSALLEILSLNADGTRHQSLLTRPNRNDRLKPPADKGQATMTIGVNVDDIRDIFLEKDLLSIPSPGTHAPNRRAAKLVLEMLERDEYGEIEATVDRQSLKAEPSFFGLYQTQAGDGSPLLSFNAKKLPPDNRAKARDAEPRHHVLSRTVAELGRRLYRFVAERPGIGRGRFGTNTQLSSDASNLPEVLDNLSKGNPKAYARYVDYVRGVLPSVKWISLKNLSANELEIQIWGVENDTEREDLAVPLRRCGTGVGQVLAIAYVVTMSENPQVLIIDEPQSFLHPGAVRELIRLFAEFDQHQYFVATHSPTVLSAASPASVTVCLHDGDQATLQTLNRNEASELRFLFDELGSSLTDVFAAERILWVEGPTEEHCFPRLLSHADQRGLAILAVKHTGDFGKKHAEVTFDLYNRLSNHGALIPPAVAFLFDREGLTEDQVADLKRAHSLLEVLPRRMYENYLVNAGAIASAMSLKLDAAESDESPPTQEDVREWLDENGARFGWGNGALQKRDMDGAKLLVAAFAELSSHTLAYDKIRDGVVLTDWLLANESSELDELAEFLTVLVGHDQ